MMDKWVENEEVTPGLAENKPLYFPFVSLDLQKRHNLL